MLRLDKAMCLSLLFKSILSEIFSNSLWKSHILLFVELISIVTILPYKSIKLAILLYTVLVIFFPWYKEYIIWQILCSSFSSILPAWACASAIGDFWYIRVGDNFWDTFLSPYDLLYVFVVYWSWWLFI